MAIQSNKPKTEKNSVNTKSFFLNSQVKNNKKTNDPNKSFT